MIDIVAHSFGGVVTVDLARENNPLDLGDSGSGWGVWQVHRCT